MKDKCTKVAKKYNSLMRYINSTLYKPKLKTESFYQNQIIIYRIEVIELIFV